MKNVTINEKTIESILNKKQIEKVSELANKIVENLNTINKIVPNAYLFLSVEDGLSLRSTNHNNKIDNSRILDGDFVLLSLDTNINLNFGDESTYTDDNGLVKGEPIDMSGNNSRLV